MRRLWMRLTVALIAIICVSMLMVALLTGLNLTTQLRSFVSRQRQITQTALIDALAAHYRANQTWRGARQVISDVVSAPALAPVSVLAPALNPALMPTRSKQDSFEPPSAPPNAPPSAPPSGPPGGLPPRSRGPTTYAVAGVDHRIEVPDSSHPLHSILTDTQVEEASSIVVDGRTVGYLIVSSPEQSLMLEAQQMFVGQLQRTVLLAAGLASIIAVILSTVITRALVAPLANLAQTARAWSRRHWSVRACRSRTQEIDDVAGALNEMAESLEQAEVNRRNLTADIAHELRTPLAVIQGNLQAMLDGVYALERSEVATIYDETRLLSRLVEDLRTLALADAGQLDLRLMPIAMSPLLDSAVEQFALVAEVQSILLHMDAPSVLPCVVADGDRVAQVLRNLISNALRHTSAGGQVTITVSHDGAYVHIAISDTGSGIRPEDLTQVFDRFYRGDRSRARSTGGSGLGLAIVRSLVEGMRGEVGVESRLGMGSTFWFTLPVANSNALQGIDSSTKNMNGRAQKNCRVGDENR